MIINQSVLQKTQLLALNTGGYVMVPFIFAIYFSTGLTTILSVLLGLCWLIAAEFKNIPEILKSQPVALWSWCLIGCFLFGLSYGSTPLNEGLQMVSKYREFFFIPLLISFLRIERYRDWAWKAFVIASVITLLVSYLKNIGVLDLNRHGDACFKSRITHSIFVSFFTYYCLHKSYQDKKYSKYYLAAVVVCLHNLFFVVEGRTGQAGLLALILLFAMQRFTMKGVLLTLLAMIISMTLFLKFSEKAERIHDIVSNTEAYLKPEQNSGIKANETSMGLRYTYWKYAAKLIAEKPLFGHGTGSFASEYKRIAVTERLTTRNPHNELLMIGVQLGAFGMLVYLGFLAQLFTQSTNLDAENKYLAQGLLLTLVITSAFNSPILDLSEGHWFVVLIALCYGVQCNQFKTPA